MEGIEASSVLDPKVYAALTATPEEQQKFNEKFEAFAVSHMSQAQRKQVDSQLENANGHDSDNDSSNEELITDLDSQQVMQVEASIQNLPQQLDQSLPKQQQECVQNQPQPQDQNDDNDVVDVNFYEVTNAKKIQDDKLKNPTPVSVQKVAEAELGDESNAESSNVVSSC